MCTVYSVWYIDMRHIQVLERGKVESSQNQHQQDRVTPRTPDGHPGHPLVSGHMDIGHWTLDSPQLTRRQTYDDMDTVL